MKISTITYLFRSEPLPEMLVRFRRLGFRYVELDYRHPDGLSDYNVQDASGAARARTILAEYGITPEAYCIGGLGVKHQGEPMRRVFEFARGLGVDTVTGLAAPEVLTSIDALCKEYGLRYAVENHRGNVFEKADDMLGALATVSDRIGINLDSGHFAAAGLDAIDETRKLRGRIYHVHLKDSDQWKPLGQGTVGIATLVEELRASGYDGMLSIEQGEAHDITPEAIEAILARSLDLVRSLPGVEG